VSKTRKRLGVIGARGFAGGELLRLVAEHPGFEVVHLASRQLAGQPFSALGPKLRDQGTIVAPSPEAAAGAGLDAVVLAMPNGEAKAYADAFDRTSPDTVIVDFSADFRGVPGWVYGLPELGLREQIRGSRRIANPGCYATSVALALYPLVPLLAGPASAFGVSGWSGAGTTPSPRNDQARLKDNVMPYGLTGHNHEKEVRQVLGAAVNFTPNVAGYFRGIVTIVHAPLTEGLSQDALRALFEDAYRDEPLISLQAEPVEAKDRADSPGVVLGGFAAVPAEKRAVVTSSLDNLLKGAASQALQNLNLTLGFDERAGLGG
jgi:N-acetyl-gamma-glutamyl-phosphate reductase common form